MRCVYCGVRPHPLSHAGRAVCGGGPCTYVHQLCEHMQMRNQAVVRMPPPKHATDACRRGRGMWRAARARVRAARTPRALLLRPRRRVRPPRTGAGGRRSSARAAAGLHWRLLLPESDAAPARVCGNLRVHLCHLGMLPVLSPTCNACLACTILPGMHCARPHADGESLESEWQELSCSACCVAGTGKVACVGCLCTGKKVAREHDIRLDPFF